MLALSINGLSKVYSSNTQALDNISFTVKPGEVVGLLGPNGAGKSTLINILCSLVLKTQGEVSIFGHNIDTHVELAKRDIGVIPQEFNFFQFSAVIDILLDQAGYFGVPRRVAKERAHHYLGLLGLWEKRNSRAGHLSGGMKRRLMIARAMMHEPRMLILDEPTAGVDVQMRRTMWEFLEELKQLNITMLLTSHYFEEVEQFCDRIVIIDKGCLLEDMNKKKLISQLQKESFIIDVKEPLSENLIIQNDAVTQIDPHTLQIDLNRGDSLNAIFNTLNNQGIEVSSMRNKANRLEELFVEYTKGGEHD